MFVDSSAYLALLDRDDAHHGEAVAILQELAALRYRQLTTNVLVMNRIAEAHAALGHAADAAAWNAKVNANYALSLGDFTNVNSRRRAKLGTATR